MDPDVNLLHCINRISPLLYRPVLFCPRGLSLEDFPSVYLPMLRGVTDFCFFTVAMLWCFLFVGFYIHGSFFPFSRVSHTLSLIWWFGCMFCYPFMLLGPNLRLRLRLSMTSEDKISASLHSKLVALTVFLHRAWAHLVLSACCRVYRIRFQSWDSSIGRRYVLWQDRPEQPRYWCHVIVCNRRRFSHMIYQSSVSLFFYHPHFFPFSSCQTSISCVSLSYLTHSAEMDTSFRQLFDHPPRGNIHDVDASTRTTGDFHRPLPSTLMPNKIVDAPQLANDIVRWAQGYLNHVQRAPGQQLLQLAASISTQLDRSQSGNEGTITTLYTRAVETWSSEFVAAADNVSPRNIRFEQCGQVNSVRSDWKWVRDNETRMIVEHKGREVFNRYCDPIRSLAINSEALGSGDSGGSITGASSILVKVSPTV